MSRTTRTAQTVARWPSSEIFACVCMCLVCTGGYYSEGCIYFAQSSWFCGYYSRGTSIWRNTVQPSTRDSQPLSESWPLVKMRLLHTPAESAFVTDRNDLPSQLALSFQSYVRLNAITMQVYFDHNWRFKSQMHITSSLCEIVPYKCAYYSLKLQSRSRTHSLTMRAQAYQMNKVYWTLTSHMWQSNFSVAQIVTLCEIEHLV